MKKNKFVDVFGFSVFSGDLDDISSNKSPIMINTISPNSYGISTKDPIFKEALKKSDYLLLDGVYFSLASIILKRKFIKKNQGPDVFSYFVNKMNKEYGRIFFLGSNEETLNKIKNRLEVEYPNVYSNYYSPPYKNEFSQFDNSKILDEINSFKPDILFVGMTCPKQEKWVYLNLHKIDAKMICSIGAVFDWFAGNQKKIHPIWWKLRLGWLKRTIDRPEILKRYPSIGIFFWHLLLAIIGFRKY